MSKAEILQEMPKLTKEERQEIRLELAELDPNEWLDEDDPLTEAEKALLEKRLEDMERHREKSIPWAERKHGLRLDSEVELAANPRVPHRVARGLLLVDGWCLV